MQQDFHYNSHWLPFYLGYIEIHKGIHIYFTSDLAGSLSHDLDTGDHLSIIGSPLLQELGLHLPHVVLVAEPCLLQFSLQTAYLLLLLNLLLLQ